MLELHYLWCSDGEFLTLDPPGCLVYGKDSTSSVPPTRNAFMSITEQTLRIGDKVVYPNHGVGVIEQISSRTIGATVEKFFTLKIQSSSLRVSIPLGNLHNVGLRRVIKNGEVQKIVDFLTTGKCENHTDWKFRFKENSEKMRTGSLLEVAFVLKSLLMLNQSKPLSFREKKMLDRARYLLVSELALAKNQGEDTVEVILTKALSKSNLRFPDVTADA
jgi:CarD family transcriptional regulator